MSNYFKKFVLLFLCFALTSFVVYAENSDISDIPKTKFDGKEYTLLYSAKNPDSGNFINEYYKNLETYTNWTELITIHHFPNSYSPIDCAKEFRNMLAEMNCPSALEEFEDENFAILDFILIDSKRLPIIIEFNVFKYEKDEICGTIAVQYAKRYRINSPLEVERLKKEFLKSRSKIVKKIKKYTLPKLIVENVENGQYVQTEAVKNIENIDLK